MFGLRERIGYDDGDDFAIVAHFVDGDRRTIAHVFTGERKPFTGHNSMDAGGGERAACIQREDARMGVWACHQSSMKHPLFFEIVRIFRPAGHFIPRFFADDAFTDGHGGVPPFLLDP